MWRIHLIKNTVKVPKKAVKELYKELEDSYQFTDGFDYFEEDLEESDYKLPFNPDSYEHMDHIDSTKNVLKKYKVSGDVIFADFEQGPDDPEKCFWGYRFDGKGGMKELKAKVNFEEV